MSFNIINSGRSSYIINNVSNPTINLVRGNQYIFEIKARGHPFWIQTSSGSYNSENIYSDGITNNGIEDGTLMFNVEVDAPDTLYYVCEYHSSMRGVINITSPAPNAPKSISATSSSSSSAVVSFTSSSDATSYTVTSSPGSINATGNSSPITINGLTSGILYTFTVTAKGPGGNSKASSASSSIILKPTIQCLNQNQVNSVQIKNNAQLGKNVYTFNNVQYDNNGFIGVNDGIYQLTGVPISDPIGFIITNTSLFEVTQGTLFNTNTINGITVKYYTGNITFKVKGDFNIISYICYYHGYMGGQSHLKYSNTCPVFQAPAVTPVSSSKSLFTYNSRVYYKPHKMFMYTSNKK